MYDAVSIARFVINYSNKQEYGISNLKLQKIMYFIQAYFLITQDKPCFSDDIEAWDFGPVVPAAYHEFKQFGSGNIPYIDSYFEGNLFLLKKISLMIVLFPSKIKKVFKMLLISLVRFRLQI